MKNFRLEKNRAAVVVACVAGIFSAISTSAGAEDKAQATQLCEAAEAARKMSAEAGHEWTTVGPLIKKGQEAIEKGELESALKLCEKARFQGEAAVEQANIESATWTGRMPAN